MVYSEALLFDTKIKKSIPSIKVNLEKSRGAKSQT